MKEIPVIAAAGIGLIVFWIAKSYVPWFVAAILGFVVLTLIIFGWGYYLKKQRPQ